MGPKPLAVAAGPARLGASTVPEARIPRLTPARGSDPTADGGDAARREPAAPLEFERVYEAEFDFVWRSLLLLGVASNAVEDATQDVFSVVSRRLGSFEGRSALRTWLFAILQRVASNQRRTVRRKQRQLEPLDDAAVSQLPTPHAQVEAAESIDLVQRFCDTLAPDWRAVFVLALLEELPAPEVSQALGIPVNTVYSRVRQLREGLRRMLAEQEEELRRG